MDSVVISGFLQGFLSGVVPSLVALYASRKYLSKKRSQKTCLKALEDLKVCLKLYKKSIDMSGDKSITDRKVRAAVFEETGLRLSGDLTPSVLDKKIESYTKEVGETLPL